MVVDNARFRLMSPGLKREQRSCIDPLSSLFAQVASVTMAIHIYASHSKEKTNNQHPGNLNINRRGVGYLLSWVQKLLYKNSASVGVTIPNP